jgi:mono/diheme cytochrome c family protein
MVVAAAVAALASAGSYADSAGGKAAADSAQPDRSGAEVYAHICQGCHQPQAQGAVGAGRIPALAGDRTLVTWEATAVTVLLGRHAMPAFGKPVDPTFVFGEVHISDAEIAAVVNFVRSHFGNQFQDKATAAKVAALPHPIN